MKSARARLHLFAARLHKWLAVIVGVQLLLWFSSGALMSFLPIEKVRGEHLVDRNSAAMMPASGPYADAAAIVRAAGAPVESMTWRMLAGRPVVEAATAAGTVLIDARSARPLPPVDARTAALVAAGAWQKPAGAPANVVRVVRESTEYRGPLPAWRVAFADPDRTNVFVTAETGRIAAVRTGTWRLYDFFWGLHIMDWRGHENFNTPWLLGFAVGGLLLWMAGAVLLYARWRPVRLRGTRTTVP